MPRPLIDADSVFLNIPYDKEFESLYIAYIVGLVELGLTPRATLSDAVGTTRLDRIFEQIQGSRYSLHDLSRVELDTTPPITPRFNMPFELGLAIAWEKLYPKRHTWFVFESVGRRAEKSLSDLKGTDFNIHDGTAEGVMRELSNAFVRRMHHPTVPQMMQSYSAVLRMVPTLKREAGTKDTFTSKMFADLVTTAAAFRNRRNLA